MKVKLPENYKKMFTIEQLEQAKRVIAFEKQDSAKIEDYAEEAIHYYLGHENEKLKAKGLSKEEERERWDCLDEVLTCKAEVALNYRNGEDKMGDDSGFMDVWIKANCITFNGFMIFGFYLSDFWHWRVDERDLDIGDYYRKFARFEK